ncbi:hypothetical protein [Streptomyces litchfieldiae]|uniref:Secreted protein n=1 Tax=Streptomyces litchfieldiae TaxID=3075543 RepID=A0ABU2MK38_9ACTN|nr:hypothetical protein [Streptomyces sp. DSM 44938]MDT0341976.1 hypothetical protein [Streptomyces sp. DSM 44938]
MTAGGGEGPRLPPALLTALAGTAGAGSAAARLAVEEARRMPPGPDREPLIRALLAGACRASAPEWLLVTAAGGAPETAAAALAHPDCPAGLRDRALRDAPDERLAALAGWPGADVVGELRRRMPERPTMTPELVKAPTPAQTVLRSPGLPDDVFDAAVGLLPGPPAEPRQGQPMEDWVRGHRAALHAWKSMWLRVLVDHPDRHGRLLSLLGEAPAGAVVRDLLLGTLPWAVEPALLEEVALADLDRFAGAVLATRICRALLAGASRDEAGERFAQELKSLSPQGRYLPEAHLGELGLDAARGARAAVEWVARAAEERWRLLLQPPEDRPWRMPERDRAALGRRFAETARAALALWEPDPDRPVRRARQVRWVRDMLLHLPKVSPEVRDGARLLLADAARGRGPRDEETVQLLAAIEHHSAAGVGDPAEVTVAELAALPAETLTAYLDAVGGDAAVEKALLAAVVRDDGDGPPFAEVLARHSAPSAALARLGGEVRRLLDEEPAAVAAWTREVLAAPATTAEAVRALPARAALAHGGPVVAAAVTEALGEDAAAWERFAAGPAARSRSGLGKVLDAAREEAEANEA